MTNDNIEEIADTVYEMMTGNPPIYDPRVTEIVRRHTGKNPESVQLQIWRDALTDVRDVLTERVLTQNAHIVNTTYYEHFRESGAATLEEAQSCICAFEKAEGIRLPSAKNGDSIYTASLLHNAKCGTAKSQKAVDKGLTAANNRELSTEQLIAIVNEGADLIRNYYQAANELERRGRSLAPLFPGDGMPVLDGRVTVE